MVGRKKGNQLVNALVYGFGGVGALVFVGASFLDLCLETESPSAVFSTWGGE